MSTTTDSEQLSIEQVTQKAEDYRTTIHALEAISSFLTWDEQGDKRFPEAKLSIGRKMGTTDLNKVSPSTTVTPDAVIQQCGILVVCQT